MYYVGSDHVYSFIKVSFVCMYHALRYAHIVVYVYFVTLRIAIQCLYADACYHDSAAQHQVFAR